METNLFKYIWQHSKGEQLVVLFVVLASLPFYFMSLNLPKDITNQAIQGLAFEESSTATFLSFDLGLPEWVGGTPEDTITLFGGFEMERMPFLFALSFSFLALVMVNGLFKFTINTMKGRMGERMLRRLRYSLFERILRFPTMYFRKIRSAEAASMINNEVEPLGGFIGDAFVQPVFLGGQALTAMAFILTQNFALGAVALGIVLIQTFIIPKLRKAVLKLGKQRQLAARNLSGRVGEVVDSIREVRVNDTSNFERSDVTMRLGRIFHIRYELYQRKFFIKFLNNLLAQMTPFLFYTIGGYFAIKGELDIGQLLAVLVAYKDLPGPIKELIDWDQQRLDVQIKYEQVMMQFMPDNMVEEHMQDPDAPCTPLEGNVSINGVGFEEDTGGTMLDGAQLEFPINSHVAFTGTPNSGRDYLAQLMARIYTPTSGTIRYGEANLSSLPEATTGRRIAYVGQDIYLLPLSILNNIFYGIKNKPSGDFGQDDPEVKHRLAEAVRSGNSPLDIEADWLNYEVLGTTNRLELDVRLIDIIRIVGMESDLYQFGLNGIIDSDREDTLVVQLLLARQKFREKLQDPTFAHLIEPFDPEKYNTNATLSENLLFGTATGEKLKAGNRSKDPYLRSILDSTGMYDMMLSMGIKIAETTVELFADLPPGHAFFEQFSFISSDDLPEFEEILNQIRKEGEDALSEDEKARLTGLTANYVESRHRFGLIGDAEMEKALEVRRQFRENLPVEYEGEISFYNPEIYNKTASIQDNILMGRITYGQAEAMEKVLDGIEQILDELGIRPQILRIGLEFNVGGGGKRLSTGQRQRIGLARALMKNPDLLIIDEALAVIDSDNQKQLLDRVKSVRKGKGLVWSVERPEMASGFDEVFVFDSGRMVEKGDFKTLSSEGMHLPALLAS